MSRFTTCGLTILLAFAPAALAVDGTVLINQSTSTNGLPGCGNTPHVLISICQSGSYRLSGNLTVPDANTNAIDIFADNVTLDLNGFAILGPVTCKPGTFPVQCSTTGTGTGIFGFNITTNNFALSNGTINGMGGAGVEVRGTGTRIDGLRVANSGGGIIVNQAVISNCTVTTNAGNGILVESSVDPIALFQVRGNTTVNQSIISFNGGFGIGGNGNGTAFLAAVLASNNSVFQNGQDGMNDVTLAVNNMIYGNVGFGFSCDSNAVCSFEGNVLLNNSLGVTKNSTSLGHNSCNGTVC